MIGIALAERRSSPRRTLTECAWLIAARLRPGRDVQLIDLSSGGALVEAGVRLLPGSPIVLHLVSTCGPHSIRGIVLRCHVCALDRTTGVRYRAALGFDHAFAIPEDPTPTFGGIVNCPFEAAGQSGTGS